MADLPAAVVPDATYYVDSGGQVRPIPADQAGDADAMGWSPASPEQAKDYELQAKYGDTAGQLKAGAAAAARALTFGGSDVALTRSGIAAPETLRGLEEANPVASTVGTVAGIAVPLVLSGGAAAPAEAGAMGLVRGAADLSAPALVSRAGQAVTKVVGEALPGADGFLGRVVAKAVASGAGSAIEGAAYGAGQDVSEAALGDPDLTAQSALATIGVSAALGGGLGALLGVAHEAVPAAVQASRYAIGSAFGKLKSEVETWYAGAEGVHGVNAATAQLIIEHKLEVAALEQQAPGIIDTLTTSSPATAASIIDNASQFGALEREFPGVAKTLSKTRPDTLSLILGKPAEFANLEREFPGTLRQLSAAEPSTAQYLADNWTKIVRDPVQRARLSESVRRGGQQIIDSTDAMFKKAYGQMMKEGADALLADANPVAIVDAYRGLQGKAVEAVNTMEARPSLFDPYYPAKLRTILEDLQKDTPGASPARAAVAAGEHPLTAGSETRLVPLPEGDVARSAKIPSWLSPDEFAENRQAWDWTWAATGGPDAPEPMQRLVFHHMQRAFAGSEEGFNFGANAIAGPDEFAIKQGWAAARLAKGMGGRRFSSLQEKIEQWAHMPADARPPDPIPEGAWGALIDTSRKDIVWGEGNKYGDVKKVDALGKWLQTTRHELDPETPKLGGGVVNWYFSSEAPAAKAMVGGLEGNVDPATAFKHLVRLRQEIGDKISWGKSGLIPPAERDAQQLMKGLYRELSDTLKSEEVFGAAGARKADLDEAFSSWKRLTERRPGAQLGKSEKGTTNFNFLMMQSGALSPNKMNAWFKHLGDDTGALKTEAWSAMMDGARRSADAVERLHQAAPVTNFDRGAISDLIEKTGKVTDDAKQRFAATQMMDELNPKLARSMQGALAAAPSGAAAQQAVGFAQGAAGLIGGPVTSTIKAVLSPISSAVDTARSFPKGVAVLASLERIGQRIGSAIDSASSTLIRGGVKAENVGRAEITAGIAREFSSSAEDSTKRFSRRVAEIQRYSSDPNAMHAALVAQGEHLEQHAPNTSQALAITSSRAISFLASKLPQDPQHGPLAPKWEPSQSEIARFARYYEAVQDPLVILKQAAAGTLTPEAVEAVQAVYPALLARIHSGLVDKLSGRGGAQVPRRSRLMLSMLTGSDVDGSLSMLAANQAAHHAPSRNGPDSVKPTSGGMQKITVASRMLTPEQMTASRRAR